MTPNELSGAGRTIRPLTEADIPVLQELDRVAYGAPWSQRTFADEVALEHRLHLVAETAGQVVGHAALWLDGATGRVTNVAVAKEHAGKGHASALLLAALHLALENRSVSHLQLEVRPANRRAQRLYSRFGFVPVGVERDFYDRSDEQGSYDAIVMAVADVCSSAWRDRIDEIALQADAGAAA